MILALLRTPDRPIILAQDRAIPLGAQALRQVDHLSRLRRRHSQVQPTRCIAAVNHSSGLGSLVSLAWFLQRYEKGVQHIVSLMVY